MMINLIYNKVLLILLIHLIINIWSVYSFVELKYNFDTFIRNESKSQLINELINNPNDPNSFARPDLSVVTNTFWNMTINFEKEIISGFIELTILKKVPSVNHVILDSSNLTIFNVIDKNSGNALKYHMSDHIDIFGSKFTIELPEQNTSAIRIFYETSPSSRALLWLRPEQTIGKKYPYLVSYCGTIYCRSMLPLQDTPSVKAPYKAIIRAPKDLVVLLSAIREDQSLINDGEMKEFRFIQSVPIPGHLFGIVVGALESRKIGPRSTIWTEIESIDKFAREFSETETILSEAESIFGPYYWGIYDLLIVPPVFPGPYGGRENPCITFIAQSVFTDDGSSADLIAHEISHSWTGNLVSNRNWEHMWLNEGFTVFMERKIYGRLYGGEQQRHFLAIRGTRKLNDTINNLGECNPITKLVPNLQGIDPVVMYTRLPYEKGQTFLFYLEDILGGPKVFEPFIRAYIENFKFQSIDTNNFIKFLYEYFNEKSIILDNVNWNHWVNSTGMPPVIPNYDTTLFNVSTSLALNWINANEDELKTKFSPNDTKHMNPFQIQEFLTQLFYFKLLSSVKVESIVNIYNLNATEHVNLRALWIVLGLQSHWNGCVNDAIKLISSYGKISLIGSIFRELYAWNETRDLAIATYKANIDLWTQQTTLAIAEVLNITETNSISF